MSGSQGGNTDNMHVVFHGLLGGFGWRLEERTHVHVKPDVRITGGDHFGSTVVAVLTHFGHHDAGTASLFGGEFVR